MQPFAGEQTGDLTLALGEVVFVTKVRHKKQWWKVRNGEGASGYVPNNILQITNAVDVSLVRPTF